MSKFEHIGLQDALESYMVYDHDVNRPDEEYTADLEEDFPVRRLFQIHKTPDGFPPKNIRNMWVGLQLPVRALVTSLEVPVLGIDALATLKMQNKTEAFDWWMDYYENNEEIHGYMMTGIPQFLNPYAKRKSLVARISFLGFNVGDGELLTISEV